MDQITLGNVTITRVWEYFGSVDMTPDTFFPESPKKVWDDNASWLTPDFLDSETNIVNSAIQTWLLRSGGKTILVDTGVGNHKDRPYALVWNRLETDFLANLARAGVKPEDVDIVINTHLHIDHVGWNTYLHDRQWVPTFPNATYLMPKDDFDFWNPANGHKPLLGRGNQNVFEDSVAPVHQAGQTLLWENSHQIDADLRLDPAPGHTPRLLRADPHLRDGPRGVRRRHAPQPRADPRAPRQQLLLRGPRRLARHPPQGTGWAADNNALVIPPAHFGGQGAAEVVREADKFDIKGWAPFAPYTEQA